MKTIETKRFGCMPYSYLSETLRGRHAIRIVVSPEGWPVGMCDQCHSPYLDRVGGASPAF